MLSFLIPSLLIFFLFLSFSFLLYAFPSLLSCFHSFFFPIVFYYYSVCIFYCIFPFILCLYFPSCLYFFLLITSLCHALHNLSFPSLLSCAPLHTSTPFCLTTVVSLPHHKHIIKVYSVSYFLPHLITRIYFNFPLLTCYPVLLSKYPSVFLSFTIFHLPHIIKCPSVSCFSQLIS